MKVTIELPDALVLEAKKRAAELGCPLRTLVERGLRAELRRSRTRPIDRGESIRLNWVTVDGGLLPGMDLADRVAMHEWLITQK